MLVLSRKHGEEILIGDDVVITIVSVKGGDVRLGITAPRNVPVYRRELYEEIRREETKP
jgi:carbon storage regulator